MVSSHIRVVSKKTLQQRKRTIMNLRKTITPLLWRVIVFSGLFVIISGLIGPKIISGGILFRDGFVAYAEIGKALFFGLIAFMLLVRHSKVAVALRPWQPAALGWILMALVLFIVTWINIDRLIAHHRDIQILAQAHVSLLLCLICTALGCIGLRNVRLLWRSYRREIMSAVVIASVFYVFLLLVYALWQPIASVVLTSVDSLLGLSGLEGTVIPPNTLIFDKFGITVAEYCSGVESIALFTSLYAIVGLLDWHRIHKKRYFLIFPLALLILFGCNILRVYGLILIGYHVNPQIAFSLFHTYAGMVFFVLFSAVFWAVSYKYLIKQSDAA